MLTTLKGLLYPTFG